MQERGAFGWGFGVGEAIETGYTETDSVASLSTIHVIAQSQNDLQQFLEFFTAGHFLWRFHHSHDLWFHFADT